MSALPRPNSAPAAPGQTAAPDGPGRPWTAWTLRRVPVLVLDNREGAPLHLLEWQCWPTLHRAYVVGDVRPALRLAAAVSRHAVARLREGVDHDLEPCEDVGP